MFRFPSIPSVEANRTGAASPSELADFWEICCLRSARGKASLQDVKHALQRPADSDPGEDDEDDIRLEGMLEDAVTEIRDRQHCCVSEINKYPFIFEEDCGSELQIELPIYEKYYLYLFLLLASHFDMGKKRSHGGHDGSLLFEEVCEVCLGSLLNIKRRTMRFGASKAGGSFPQHLAELCENLKDGTRVKPHVPYQQDSGDDGLDVAAWIPFSDGRRGLPIIFAQCKTGSSWKRADMTRLNTEVFCSLWMEPRPQILPSKAFMVSLRCDVNFWEPTMYGGVFFDRCRVMECSSELSGEVLQRVREWVEAAMQSPLFTLRASRPSRGRGRARS